MTQKQFLILAVAFPFCFVALARAVAWFAGAGWSPDAGGFVTCMAFLFDFAICAFGARFFMERKW